MRKHGMWFLSIVVCAGLVGARATGETWRLKDGEAWEPVEADPQEQFRHAVAELKDLVRAGDKEALKERLAQVEAEFPDRVGPDLRWFLGGELYYWRDNYTKSLVKFERLMKDYPGSEYVEPALDREFDIGMAYLRGRKKSVLGILKLSAYDEGIEIMERISDRAGLDDPNGVGLRAAIAVAEHFERRDQYLEAHLKWAEIASYWETGPIGKRALYRMAENNMAAYNEPPVERRPHLDASKLTAARTYYEKFQVLYPEEAKEREVPQKIERIDEQMAYKQFTIGQYYRRTGEPTAANLYFDMVVDGWPETEAAEMARAALDENLAVEAAGGK